MKKILLKTLLAVAAFTGYTNMSSAQGMMTTIIGTGTEGYSGDGGLASAATLNLPSDICMDAADNIYIVDHGNKAIRKVHAISNIITTIAGNGTSSYSGDGGPAANATFIAPGYMCIDQQGNLYISDGGTYHQQMTGSGTVRKINAQTGIITTVAGNGTNGFSGDGGPATAAQLNYPKGIALDAAGNLYIVDRGNNRIRRVDAQSGIITTIAGDGTASVSGDGGPAIAATLNSPTAITITNADDIYFSDNTSFMSSQIRKIDAQTGIITNVAGLGTYFMEAWPAAECHVGGIWGMTHDDYGNIYINDESCSCRRIDSTSGMIYRIAGDTISEGPSPDGPALTQLLYFPLGMCLDPATGNIIIANSLSSSIKRVTQPDYVPYTPEDPQSVSGANVAAVISIFPNPATDRIVVKSATANGFVQVYNATGSIVYQQALSKNETTIDLSQHPAGNYFVTTIQNGKRETQKLLLVK
jgi:sugar lactone lactonase YvrE